ncbi:MAG: hypothetical protein KAH86_08620, partial [Methanosarcinales archaeon]|nr:hypothetical protein [Methanosarcinales archaeon]
VKLVDFETGSDTTNVNFVGTKIQDVLSNPTSYTGSVSISGKVSNIDTQGGFMYMQLTDDTTTMWIASNILEINEGELITAGGTLMFDFSSPSTGVTYPVILFAGEVAPLASTTSSFQKVTLEIYKNNKKIGGGTATYAQYKNGDTSHPMVSRSLWQDEYVIFQGMSGYGVVPLTLKIVPMVNELWIGVILFSLGSIMTMVAAVMAPKRRKKRDDDDMEDEKEDMDDGKDESTGGSEK